MKIDEAALICMCIGAQHDDKDADCRKLAAGMGMHPGRAALLLGSRFREWGYEYDACTGRGRFLNAALEAEAAEAALAVLASAKRASGPVPSWPKPLFGITVTTVDSGDADFSVGVAGAECGDDAIRIEAGRR